MIPILNFRYNNRAPLLNREALACVILNRAKSLFDTNQSKGKR